MPDNGIPPFARYRRLRSSAGLRRLVGETKVSVDDFIYPLFITAGENIKAEIPPMPGCYHLSVDRLSEELDEIEALGIPGVLLFGLPPKKTPSDLTRTPITESFSRPSGRRNGATRTCS